MKIYSVGDNFTGESKFFPSLKEAKEVAQSTANRHGWCTYVDEHDVPPTKMGLINFLNHLPIETLISDMEFEPANPPN